MILNTLPDLVHLDRIDYSSDHGLGDKMDKLRRTRTFQPVLTDGPGTSSAQKRRTHSTSLTLERTECRINQP
jgi:hypothetical protein